MTTDAKKTRRKPSRHEMTALRLWHAVLAGGYLVAFLSGDEDTYAMHMFSGYVVLAAMVLRLLAGVLAPEGSPLRLPRLRLTGPGRNPLFGWIAVAVLAAVGASAATGALADSLTWLEDLHEGLSEASLWVIGGHILFIFAVYGGWKKLLRAAPAVGTALVLLASAPQAARAADPRAALLAEFAAQAKAADPAFAGFSAQRGEELFRTQWKGGDERTPACTSCHTADPRQAGRNAKTGRPIDPVAVSINPKRFTEMDQVEKQFGRDCKSVLGRECTAREKGDYITFMAGQ